MTSPLTPEQIAELLALAKKAKFGHFDLQQFTEKFTPCFAESLLDMLEASEKRNAELEREKDALRPVGVMSEKAFHRLEGSESRFIALWPRPGIYLPRKRPDDGVIVYARTGISLQKGEG